MNPEEIPKPEQEKFFERNKLIKALTLVGAAAFVEACGVSADDIERMPRTTVEQLSEHPEQFAKLAQIKVVGRITFEKSETSKETRMKGTPVMLDKDPTVIWTTEAVLVSTDFYKLDSGVDDSHSFSVHMVDDDGSETMPRLTNGQAYQLVGAVESMPVAKDSKEVVYYLKISPKDPKFFTPFTKKLEEGPK